MVSSVAALAILAGGFFGCAGPSATSTAGIGPKDPLADRVLVVINDNSQESVEIGQYYVQKRQVPSVNVFHVKTTTLEQSTVNEFNDDVAPTLRQKLSAMAGKIDYIVLTKGFPLKFRDGRGVDAYISVLEMSTKTKNQLRNIQTQQMVSPYLGKDEKFSRQAFGFYLVTRLDGYTVSDAKALVDRSLSAKPDRGLFVFDEATNRRKEGYGKLQAQYVPAMESLRARGFSVLTDTEKSMLIPKDPVMGYMGWGSNDSGFNVDDYHRLRFKPGAIAETFVSTGGRTFQPTTGGQSLIADLISQGVTGVKGYVSEPFLFSMAQPEVLFDRYTKGYTLAESYYMASPILGSRDVIIGDPICRPYRK